MEFNFSSKLCNVNLVFSLTRGSCLDHWERSPHRHYVRLRTPDPDIISSLYFVALFCVPSFRPFQPTRPRGHSGGRHAEVDERARLRARRAVSPDHLHVQRRPASARTHPLPERPSRSRGSLSKEGELVYLCGETRGQSRHLAMWSCKSFGNGEQQRNRSECTMWVFPGEKKC